MSRFSIVSLFWFLISCHGSNKKPDVDFKYSFIKEHLARIDSLEFYDTLNYDYQLLKAYMNNDSVFFKHAKEVLELLREQAIKRPASDTCFHLQKLSDMDVDEVYRFHHAQSFCYFSQYITISRNRNTIKLHYLELSLSLAKITFKTGHRPELIDSGCKVVKEFNKSLSVKDWDNLELKIFEADFWGLLRYEPRLMFDGSSWTIEAYTKRPRYVTNQQAHMVNRQCTCSDSFEQLGRYFLKLSGEKTFCGSLE
jgi:hypothetical protein